MSGFTSSGKNKTSKPIIYQGLQVSAAGMDVPITNFWGTRRLSTFALWYNDFQKHKQSAKGKGGGGKGSGQYDYTAAVIIALGEGVIDSIQNVWEAGSTTTSTTLAALNLTFFDGSAAQAPWSFVTTKYPAQARSYGLTSYLANPRMDLGSSATIPDNGFEGIRAALLPYSHTTTKGWINPTTMVQSTAVDVLLPDVIADLFTSTQYGMGFVSGDLADRTAYATYNRAQGLFFSPLLNGQSKCTDVVDRWAQVSNTWIYWSGTQFQFVPLGDVEVTGNGVTYTPDNSAAYDLGPADFVTDESNPIPITVTRKDPADCYNTQALQIVDRTIGYTSNPIPFKDQTLVDLYGRRDSGSIQGDDICDPDVGAIVVQLIGKRGAYLRNTYAFKGTQRFVRCLPGTVLTLTEPNIGLNKFRVRVRTIEEGDDGSLAFVCEEFPGAIGSFTPPAQGAPASVPTTPDLNALPGNINTPAIVEPDSSFTGGVPRVLIAASGGANWGGAYVYVSFNGTDYSPIGTITEAAIQGVLTAPLASHADPDTVNTLSVDCTESLSVPQPVTTDDADALRTLSLVAEQPTLVGGSLVVPTDGELLAFGNESTTATYAADLTYLRRGQYGSLPGSHSSGDQFTVVDVLLTSGSTIAYNLPPQYIGQPIYFKLASFNAFGNAVQDLSTVDEYVYTPAGYGYGGGSGGVPSTPATPSATPQTGLNLIAWSANPSTDNVLNYQVWRAPGLSASFGSASLLQGVGTATNFADTTATAGAAYTYFIVAVNAVGSSPNSLGANCTSGAAGGNVVGPSSSTNNDFVQWDGITGKLAKDGGLSLDTDGTLAANSDSKISSQKAVKTYVDGKLAGLSWKQEVRAATTANGTLATAYANGQVIDGVTLATGDRILIKNQTTGTENGIYTVNVSGTPTRATDANTGPLLVNAACFSSEGTTLADTCWVCTTNAPITIGSTAIAFAQFGAGLTYSADEVTIHLSGTTFSIKNGGVGPTQLANTTVVAGTYTNCTVTFDAQGRATAASSGVATGALPLVTGDTGGSPVAIADPVGQFISCGATTAGRSITNYFGAGLAAARPATPDVGTGASSLWYSTDNGTFTIWTGSAWANP